MTPYSPQQPKQPPEPEITRSTIVVEPGRDLRPGALIGLLTFAVPVVIALVTR